MRSWSLCEKMPRKESSAQPFSSLLFETQQGQGWPRDRELFGLGPELWFAHIPDTTLANEGWIFGSDLFRDVFRE